MPGTRTDTPKRLRWGCCIGGGWHSETECQVESSIIVGDQYQGSAIPLRLAGECNCFKWCWSFSLHPSSCQEALAQGGSTFLWVLSGLESWKREEQSHSVFLFIRSKCPFLSPWVPSDLWLPLPPSRPPPACVCVWCAGLSPPHFTATSRRNIIVPGPVTAPSRPHPPPTPPHVPVLGPREGVLDG